MHTKPAEEEFWSEAWTRHIDAYLAAPLRCGYWLGAHFGLGHSVLELAGGNCRDSRYRATRGARAIGTDCDRETLTYLAHRFPGSPLELRREDALELSLSDKAVDLSFSNGSGSITTMPSFEPWLRSRPG